MKAKITKTVFENDKIEYVDILYNFCTIKEAQKRLLSIKNKCIYNILVDTKTRFVCDKGFTKLEFKVERQ